MLYKQQNAGHCPLVYTLGPLLVSVRSEGTCFWQQAAAAAAAAAPVAPGMSGGAAVASGGSNAGGYAGVDSPTPGMSAQSNGSPLQQLQAPLAQHV